MTLQVKLSSLELAVLQASKMDVLILQLMVMMQVVLLVMSLTSELMTSQGSQTFLYLEHWLDLTKDLLKMTLQVALLVMMSEAWLEKQMAILMLSQKALWRDLPMVMIWDEEQALQLRVRNPYSNHTAPCTVLLYFHCKIFVSSTPYHQSTDSCYNFLATSQTYRMDSIYSIFHKKGNIDS